MKDSLNDAHSEMRRVDHLIHVSLKYTRTVDVLISVLQRFITCLDNAILVLLKKAKEDGKIESIPDSPVGKAKTAKELYQEEIIIEILDDYMLFRRLVRSEYTKRNEYRRYVTMIVDDNGTIVEIDIDKVVEYYEKIKKALSYIAELIE